MKRHDFDDDFSQSQLGFWACYFACEILESLLLLLLLLLLFFFFFLIG